MGAAPPTLEMSAPKEVPRVVDEVTIGARLRTLRRWRGKSQVELAGLAGLSPSFLSMVETGQRPLDRRSHIAALASALKVSETDLVGGPHLTPDPLQSDPHMGIPALRVALQTNTFTAKNLNYTDLAHLAALRAEQAAARLNDPIYQGKADFVWLLTLPRAGSWDRNLTAAERVANQLEPHASDPLGLQVLGMITLTASLAAASVQRGDTAQHWLDEATDLADRVPDQPMANWQSFSTTNVNIWRVAVGVERGEAGTTMLKLADQVSLDGLEKQSSRRADFFADVGRGLAREPRTRTEAVRWLRRAEEAAPQRIRNSAPVRETVAYLLNRARAAAGGPELRGMAARMGLPH